MKSALCLCGKVGGNKGKDGLGERIDYALCYESYREHVIDVNRCDVFMHCWDVDLEDEMRSLYRPERSVFSPQFDFSPRASECKNREAAFRAYSRWFSTRESVKLKRLHEQENGFVYDWVMVGRYDLLFMRDIDFSALDPTYFHAPVWNAPPLLSKRDRVTGKLKPDRMNRTEHKQGLSDLLFIASSAMMDEFSTVFDHLDEYGPSGHYAAWRHVKETFGDPMKIVKYTFYRWFDFEIYRFKVCGVYR